MCAYLLILTWSVAVESSPEMRYLLEYATRESIVTTLPREIVGIFLAAGAGQRFGGNKQMAVVNGETLVARSLGRLLQSKLSRLVVVVGSNADMIKAEVARLDCDLSLLLKESTNDLGHVARQQRLSTSESAAPRRLTIVRNEAWASGMASSLRCGLAASQNADAVAVCLADMPWLATADIDRLVTTYMNSRLEQRAIVCPVFRGRRGHPVVFGSAHFSELAALNGDCGARAVLQKHSRDVQLVEASSAGILLDVDVPEDLK